MQLMLILFDSYGGDPSGNVTIDAQSVGWIKSFTDVEQGQFASNPDIITYLGETVNAVDIARNQNPGAQVIYDMWNEPAQLVSDGDLEHAITTLKGFTNERATIGFARVGRVGPLLSSMITPANLDVISMHPYGMFQAVVQAEVAQARAYAQSGGLNRSIVASEIVNHGLGTQDYGHILGWMEEEGVGFFAWEAFASETIFAGIDGLFYDEPSIGNDIFVRDVEGVNKMLSMAVAHGFEPTKVARLLPATHSAFIEYSPFPYDFNVAKAHDLLLNWNARYYGEAYTRTMLEGFLDGDDTPIKFYYQILYQAVSANSAVDPYMGIELIQKNALRDQANSELAVLNGAFSVYASNMTMANTMAVEDAISDLEITLEAFADFLRDTRIDPIDPMRPGYATNPLENSTPEVVYFKYSWLPLFTGGAGAGSLKLHVDMLFSDVDRLEDIVYSDILYSLDGGTYIGLNLVPSDLEPNASGYLETTISVPPLMPGQSLRLRAKVMDRAGAVDLVDAIP